MEQNVGRRISGLGLAENRVHLAWGGGLSSKALGQWWLLSGGWVFLWEFLRRHYWDELLSVPGASSFLALKGGVSQLGCCRETG